MKRTASGKPYLSWCVVVRNSERTLEATLKSVRERTPDAEIVVVDTASRDRTPEIAQRYADVWELYRGPRGDWQDDFCPECKATHDEVGKFCQGCGAARAVDDMAAARERSFALASGRWRAWIDGDDRLPGPEEAAALLNLNSFGPGRGFAAWGAQGMASGGQLAAAPAGDWTKKGEAVGLEDLLRWLEENHPQMAMLKAPYLYRKDEKGQALDWLERERIVRWDDPPAFRWAEAAHEILVPKQGVPYPPRFVIPLLFVHEKDWTCDEDVYSLKRHGAIMLKQFDAGDRTHRRARYLAGTISDVLCPERKQEFVEAAHAGAFTVIDRYRSLVVLAEYRKSRGLRLDAREAYAAAQDLCPGLPDAWHAAALASLEAEDWIQAVIAFRRGVACELSPESEVVPRRHAVEYPTLLSMTLQRVARDAVQQGRHEDAAAYLQEATEIADRVRGQSEAVGPDKLEAQAYFLRARNRLQCHLAVMGLARAWRCLLDNDEPQKALALLDAFPWATEDHPLRVGMEAEARKIRRHIDDPAAYRAFYASEAETGYTPMAPEHYTYEGCHSRVRWAVDWIKANAPNGTVLDLGCCDGILGLPLLKTCPGVLYRGVDVCEQALENFRRMLAELPADPVLELQTEHGEWPDDFRQYDVVVAGEILEHVPDPVAWLRKAAQYLKGTGTIIVTTPWGSFDEGHPPPKTAHGTPRDPRGHLRAYSPEQAVLDLRAAGLQVDEVTHQGALAENGHAMLIRARPGRHSTAALPHGHTAWKHRPIAVCVPGALWDWNGSTVDRGGMGASEGMIVRLGEELAGERRYDVFGPVPHGEGEVYKGVGYFAQAALRRFADEDTKLVVSRCAPYIRTLDEFLGRELPAVLWLQDTGNVELRDPALAARYEHIVCVSEWHREHTIKVCNLSPEISAKVKVAYNFVQPTEWETGIAAAWPQKKRDHFIYASSPDRGVVKLLRLWPRIREMFPEATLSIFYGWRGCMKLGSGLGSAAWMQRFLNAKREYEALYRQLRTQGVTEYGMVDHRRIAQEFQRAGVWAYPTRFSETGCTVAVEARAGGAVPVTTMVAALTETALCRSLGGEDSGFLRYELTEDPAAEDGFRFDEDFDERFLEAIRRAVDVPTEARQAMAREAIERFSFESQRKVWDEVLR